MGQEAGSSLRSRAVHSGAWIGAGFAVQKVLQLGSNLVLTRLLFPEAFGLMALANVILIGLTMFSDIGIKPAIIQSTRGEDEAFLNTAWSMQIVRGFVIWIGAAVLAYPASLIYGQPQLFPLIAVLGGTAGISGFASISLASSERRLMIGRVTIIQVISQFITLIITILMAWKTQSFWALAYGAVIGSAANTLLSYMVIPTHKHRFVFEADAFVSLFRFGRWIFVSTLITYLGGQGLRAIQGAYVSPTELGILAIAQTLAWIPGDITAQIMNVVGFSALSEIRRRGHNEMVSALKSMRLKVVYASLPIFIGLSLGSGIIINIMYDQRYEQAGSYLAIIALTGAISVITMGYQSALMAMGKVRLHTLVLTVAMVGRICGLAIGFYLYQVPGMLIGIGIGGLAGYIIAAISAKRLGFYFVTNDICFFSIISIGAYASWSIYG